MKLFIITSVIYFAASLASATSCGEKSAQLFCNLEYGVNGSNPNISHARSISTTPIAAKFEVVNENQGDPDECAASVNIDDSKISGLTFSAYLKNDSKTLFMSLAKETLTQSPQVSLQVFEKQNVNLVSWTNKKSVMIKGEEVDLYSVTFICHLN